MNLVFVAGSLHLDVVVNAPTLPRLDETVVGQKVNYQCGGKGANQAIAASRMGGTAAMAGCIGNDYFGTQLRDCLDASGVNHTQVETVSGASGMSVAIVDTDGAYGAVIVSAANLTIDANALEIPANASLLLLQNEIPAKANLVLARKAHAQGVRVLLNAAPVRPVQPELFNLVDILVVNRIEAAGLTGAAEQKLEPAFAGKTLAALGPEAVIITEGSAGLTLWHQHKAMHQPALRVESISTHGAGDIFIGALATKLAGDIQIAEAIDFAQAAAAWHVATPVTTRNKLDAKHVTNFQNQAR